MKPIRLLAAGFTLAQFMTMAGGALAAEPPVRKADGVLVNTAGMTLYTFDKDTAGSGKSACNDACATLWPPLKAEAADAPSGGYAVVTRDDGSRQWAYQGKPLYLYASDRKPGDRTGDKFKDVWHVVRD